MRTDHDVVPSFELVEDGQGVEVLDPIERRRCTLQVPAVDALEAEPGDPFDVPVDAAAGFRAERVRLREYVDVVVRDGSGEMVAEVKPLTESALPAGEYQVDLNGPIKLCLHVESELTVSGSMEGVSIDFPEPRRVSVGARSYHRRPASTITTPADPDGVAAALSVLGSALKTTSPERSYPTLRGHPPAIEIGDELRVPTALSRPDTGVSIRVRPAYEQLFAVAPLAYYLGAEVVAGGRPRIVTDAGLVHPLDGRPGGVEREAERVLKRAFFLDCLVRTEGIYRIPLAERAAIDSLVDVDHERLYADSLAGRLEASLSLPFETIEPHLPTWNLVAHVPPAADRVEVLPYVIDSLAVVRSPDARSLSPSTVRTSVLSAYLAGKTGSGSDGRTRGGGEAERDDDRIVRLAATDSMEDAWFGASAPLNGTKSLAQAYRNRFERSDRGWPIDIAVVCNERDMDAESTLADSVYGSREEFIFDVTLHRDVATAELRDVLASEVDFLHYVGHTTAEGFHCRDGVLDAGTLEGVGVGTFFLNSCRSYRQGRRLIEAGSVGGVVTLSHVNDAGAAAVGRTMARLLNRGFPLRAALDLAGLSSPVGGHYIVLGDGTFDLAAAESGLPVVCRVAEVDERRYDATIEVFLPREGGMGATVFPLLEGNERHYLAPGRVETFRVTDADLERYLTRHPVPVLYDGELLLEGAVDRLDL